MWLGCSFHLPSQKPMRAQSIIGRMAQNSLYCPFGALWFPEFRRELLACLMLGGTTTKLTP
jgi:hypothetical protein